MGRDFNSDSIAKTRCYIVNNSSDEKMEFQFNPTSIPYSRGAKYNSIESPGMSYPITQYVGGEVREFTIKLFYYDVSENGLSSDRKEPYEIVYGGDKTVIANHAIAGKINKARKFLEDLLPPEYNGSDFIRPPTFTLAYGYFVKTLVLVKLDVNDIRLDELGNPIQTEFTLTVRQVGRS